MRTLFIFFGVFWGAWIFAQTPQTKNKYDEARLNTPAPFTLGDRDRILTVELKLDAIQKQMDARFEAAEKRMDARFEGMQKQMDTRFEAMEKRMDGIDKRFDFLQNLLWTIIGLLAALGTATLAQILRINKLLAKHEGILGERQRQETLDALTQDVARLKRNIDALHPGGAHNA